MIGFAVYAVLSKKLGPSRMKGIARVTVYGGVIAVTVGAIGIHKARAAVDQAGLHIGEDLSAVAPLLRNGNTFVVNGQELHMAAAESLDGVSGILDKFQSSCEAAEGGDAPVWTNIPTMMTISSPTASAAAANITKMPIYRSEQGNRGFVACIIPPTGSTPQNIVASFRHFMKDGGSLLVGRLRYATVSTKATGSSVITAWTDENFDLGALLPDGKQDKPGEDPGVMLRPDGTHRMLSGRVLNLPYRVFAYQTSGSAAAAMNAYDQKMFAAGWISIQTPQAAIVPHEGFEAHAFMRDGFIGYATASAGPQGQTVMGIAETATRPAQDTPRGATKDSDGF
ncbi:MAG: hypothetical protein ABI551_25995 [Polyangiaceae bacterium]